MVSNITDSENANKQFQTAGSNSNITPNEGKTEDNLKIGNLDVGPNIGTCSHRDFEWEIVIPVSGRYK